MARVSVEPTRCARARQRGRLINDLRKTPAVLNHTAIAVEAYNGVDDDDVDDDDGVDSPYK